MADGAETQQVLTEDIARRLKAVAGWRGAGLVLRKDGDPALMREAAALIQTLQATNDDLVAALWDALEALDYAAPNFEASGKGGKKTVDIVRAALAKAEGRSL